MCVNLPQLDANAQLIIDKPSAAGGAVIKGTICVTDADADGYTDYNQTTVPPSSVRQPIYTFTNSPTCSIPYAKKSSVTSIMDFDCFDNNNLKRQHAAATDLVWASTAYQNIGTCGQYSVGKQRRSRDWTADTSIAYCGWAGTVSYQEINDDLVCCLNGYLDNDKDGYGAGANGCYTPSVSYNVVANNSDCDDASASIIPGSTRALHCGSGSCSDTGSGGSTGTQTCVSGSWNTTAACVTSTAVCCTAGSYRPNSYICSTGSFNNPANGSCDRTATDQYCTGSAATCTGTTNVRHDYGSNGQVWWSGSWQTVTATIRAGVSAANSCAVQQPQGNALACNGAGGTTQTIIKVNIGTACSGTENNLCSSGTCQNFCTAGGADNDGDEYNDNQDSNCSYGGCSQCLSGACCNSTTGCYVTGTCRSSAGVCDTAESCSGSSASCPIDAFLSNSTICSNGSATGASGSCRTSDSDQYCNGIAAACSGSKNIIYGYASTNGQVWNGSSWINASYAGVNANVTGPTCSVQTPRYSVYGCTAGANTTYLYTYYNLSACSGAENNICTGGSCQELCNDGIDNDGNGLTDDADPVCPGNQCTSGECCDTSTGRFRISSYV